jgi:hypothetical protein
VKLTSVITDEVLPYLVTCSVKYLLADPIGQL